MFLSGRRVPSITFQTRVRDESIGGDNPYRWSTLSTNDICNGKRVVIFSLPGAFTPTCSTFQVPGFEENYDLIRELGVDEVYCASVNDSFVMNKWAKDNPVVSDDFLKKMDEISKRGSELYSKNNVFEINGVLYRELRDGTTIRVSGLK